MAQQDAPKPRMLRGDEAELYRAHEVALRAAVRHRICGSDALIEDACAFAWLQLMRHQPDRGPTLFAWLRTVAVREAFRIYRQEVHHDITDLAPDQEPAATLETQLSTRSALRALATMSTHRQRIFLMHLSGLSYGEIAARLDITFTNVNRHVTRSRSHLRLVRDDH
jgi:RNA polymerase sigma factor (sigma-70 family)